MLLKELQSETLELQKVRFVADPMDHYVDERQFEKPMQI